MMAESNFIPNSYQTPNAYIDRLLPYLTLEEWAVLSYAARRVFGFQKTEDHIALSQFADGIRDSRTGRTLDEGTGLNIETVRRALAGLLRFNIVQRLAHNDPTRNQGDLWALQLDSDAVDWPGLKARRAAKEAAKKLRTEAARARNKKNTPMGGGDPLLSDSTTSVGQYAPLSVGQYAPLSVGQQHNNQRNPEKTSIGPTPTARARKRDPRLDEPAITLVRKVIRRYPDKSCWDQVISALGKEPDEERFRMTYSAWTFRGYSPRNIEGVLAWYTNGIPEPGKNSARPAGPQKEFYDVNGNRLDMNTLR